MHAVRAPASREKKCLKMCQKLFFQDGKNSKAASKPSTPRPGEGVTSPLSVPGQP